MHNQVHFKSNQRFLYKDYNGNLEEILKENADNLYQLER